MPFNGEYRKSVHPNEGVSRTKQSDTIKADINNVMEKWLRTGVPPQSDKIARYGDFSNADDYWSCTLRVHEAEKEFYNLSARVRDACDNDLGKFLQMIEVPEERKRLEELGLVPQQVPESDGDGAPEAPETPEVPA